MKYIQPELYNEIISNIPICCVDVVIMYNSQVLLVKRKDEPCKDQWWIPGGRLLKNEELRDCAIRKAYEEVGLKCFVGPMIHTEETIFKTGPNNIPVHSVNICFMVFPYMDKELKVVLDSHGYDYKWIDGIELNCYHPYVNNCLKKAGLL
jgi:colanic acid biosynthesis protein WcaH